MATQDSDDEVECVVLKQAEKDTKQTPTAPIQQQQPTTEKETTSENSAQRDLLTRFIQRREAFGNQAAAQPSPPRVVPILEQRLASIERRLAALESAKGGGGVTASVRRTVTTEWI